MKNISSVPAGGVYLENGIPDELYAFTDGEISMVVERNGGINTIHVLDILSHEGKLYPDRCATPPIIRKEGRQAGKRTLYGPGIQFISTNRHPNGRPGRNLFHVPDRLELYPFGFISESERFGHRTRYDVCIHGRTILFRFANAFPTRERLVVTLNKDHILSGKMASMKNQLEQEVVEFKLDRSGVDLSKYLADDFNMSLYWDFIGPEAQAGGFVMDGRMVFTRGERKASVLLAANRPLVVEEAKTRWLLSCPWDKAGGSDEIRMVIVVAESREDARRQAADRLSQCDDIFMQRVQKSVGYALKAPGIEIETSPHAAEYARVTPAFLQAMLMAENKDEVCIRGSTHGYGFFGMWDQVYSVRGFLLMGDYASARKLLRYTLTTPGIELHVWTIVILMTTVEEYAAFSGDHAFVKEFFCILKRHFEYMAQRADPVTGLLPFTKGYGVDDQGELGIEPGGKVWFPCINGIWYNACRGMENLAMRIGDPAVESLARSFIKKLDAHYMEVFFDPQKGYLHSVVVPQTRKNTGVYQNVSTMAMDYPYGQYLFRRQMREIAEYQAYALYHPAGRSAVAYDDNAHEMWKHVEMKQHLAHEAKAARAAGLGEEALRLVNGYLGIFSRCKVGIETQNLVGCEGDAYQRAYWCCFCAQSGYNAIVEGVAGIQWDMGGFHYVPCDIPGDMTINEFPFRQTLWNIRVSGEGASVGQFLVDGLPVEGTMRIPAHFISGKGIHRMEVVRSRKPFGRPTLLAALGAGVMNLESSDRELSFEVTERVHAIVKLFAPVHPDVKLDDETVPVEWNSETGLAWCDPVMSPGRRLVVSCNC